jgi:hypothetical protein
VESVKELGVALSTFENERREGEREREREERMLTKRERERETRSAFLCLPVCVCEEIGWKEGKGDGGVCMCEGCDDGLQATEIVGGKERERERETESDRLCVYLRFCSRERVCVRLSAERKRVCVSV